MAVLVLFDLPAVLPVPRQQVNDLEFRLCKACNKISGVGGTFELDHMVGLITDEQ
jgi:hypothetical protein